MKVLLDHVTSEIWYFVNNIFWIPVYDTGVLVTMIICFNSLRSPKYLACRILCHESFTKKMIML